MQIDINNLVSITEANQNFSRVARMVDEKGTAVILKNNAPRYVIIDYNQLQADEAADSSTVMEIAKKVMGKHKKAFEELAK